MSLPLEAKAAPPSSSSLHTAYAKEQDDFFFPRARRSLSFALDLGREGRIKGAGTSTVPPAVQHRAAGVNALGTSITLLGGSLLAGAAAG